MPRDGFPAIVDLSQLLPDNGGDATVGFVLNGIDNSDYAGRVVADAGDVNGDGIADFIVGARSAKPQGRTSAGQSYVVFGTENGFPPLLEFSALLAANGGDGSAGFALNGASAFDAAGSSVSAAGDFNNDGIGDLVVGAPGVAGGGAAYVVYGTDQGFAAELDLADLLPENGGNGSAGIVLLGSEASGTGAAVSAAGDVNGDGIADVLIGSSQASPGSRKNAGRTYVVFGGAQGLAAELPLSGLEVGGGGDGSEGFVLNGVDLYDRSGSSVANAGDVNGDGIHDLVIGARFANGDAGESYVVFGRAEGFQPEMELSDLLPASGGDGSGGFRLLGSGFEDYAGAQVSSAGDFNGDGVDDLIIGVPGATLVNVGRSFLVFGRRDGFPPDFALSSLLAGNGGDGSEGVVVLGAEADGESGYAVSAAGDVNGDGIDDLIIGAPFAGYYSSHGIEQAGESVVLFGTRQPLPAELAVADVWSGDGATGFVLRGINAVDRSGHSVRGAGDVNGDGLDDLVIGAFLADPGGRPNAGQSYVVFGRSGDGDGDGVTNIADNCLDDANPGQLDEDGDGFGTRCDADFNNDCAINFLDLAQFKAGFLTVNPLLDLDGSGEVNFGDLAILRNAFFGAPGPSGLPNSCDDD